MKCLPILAFLSLIAAGLGLGCGDVVSSPDGGSGAGDAASTSDEADGAAHTCSDCDENATCDDSGAVIECTCDSGYEGDGLTCELTNECLEDNGGCDRNALCINEPNGRRCVCSDGYSGDGETCEPIWELVAEIPGLDVDPERQGLHAAGLNGRLYFAPATSDVEDGYFKSRPISDGIAGDVRDEPMIPDPRGNGQTDFCSCGLTGELMSSGSELCIFASDGHCFDGSEWRDASYPSEFRRGEPASAAFPDRFITAAGRSSEVEAQRYLSSTDSWETLPDLPIGIRQPAGAAYDGIFYVLGGRTTLDDEDLALAYDTSDGTQGAWQSIDRIPGGASRPRAAVAHDGLIFVFDRRELVVYDIAEGAWRNDRLDLPPAVQTRSMPAIVEDRLYVIGKDPGEDEPVAVIYELANP